MEGLAVLRSCPLNTLGRPIGMGMTDERGNAGHDGRSHGGSGIQRIGAVRDGAQNAPACGTHIKYQSCRC